MALADSKEAIGAVSVLLQTQLTTHTSASTVDVGRTETAAASAGPKYNLFLYQVDVDGQLRNHALDSGQVAPLWLVLHYLLTAFDTDKESDSSEAHRLLGEGMLALRELNFIRPASLALSNNPEPLKVTFDVANVDLISKVLQGTDEKYRLSAAFQVRPVMIAPTLAPRYALPVKTVGPPGNQGVVVIPSLGPRLESLEPKKFTVGSALTIKGLEVNSSITQVLIGDEFFVVTDAAEGQVKTTVPLTTTLSAGSHPLYLLRLLPGGMTLKSDCLLAELLPTVTTATPGLPTALITGLTGVRGDLTINGTRLGGTDDTIFVAFYREGVVTLMLEAAGSVAQSSLIVTVSEDQALAAGNYYIIVRVNGSQTSEAPEITWS